MIEVPLSAEPPVLIYQSNDFATTVTLAHFKGVDEDSEGLGFLDTFFAPLTTLLVPERMSLSSATTKHFENRLTRFSSR